MIVFATECLKLWNQQLAEAGHTLDIRPLGETIALGGQVNIYKVRVEKVSSFGYHPDGPQHEQETIITDFICDMIFLHNGMIIKEPRPIELYYADPEFSTKVIDIITRRCTGCVAGRGETYRTFPRKKQPRRDISSD